MMLLAMMRRIDADGDAMVTLDELIEFLREEERPAPYNFAPIPEPRGLGSYEQRATSPVRMKRSPSPTRGASPLRTPVGAPPMHLAPPEMRSPPRGGSPLRAPVRGPPVQLPPPEVREGPMRASFPEVVTAPLPVPDRPSYPEVERPPIELHSPTAGRKPSLAPWNEEELVHSLKQQCCLESDLEHSKIQLT